MKWFVRNDIDGFFGLALDNLIQLLLIVGLCLTVLGFGPQLIFAKILPAAALSLIVGNVYYSYLAVKLGKANNRNDYCALPYGINTPSVFIYVFLVMLPVKLKALADGIPPEQASDLAWKAGLIACLGSGLIEFAGSFVAEKIRKSAPRAAMLSTLSGIALGFISLPFLFRTFAHPVIGFVTLSIILVSYFGKVRFKGKLPGGLVAIAVGIVLSKIPAVAPNALSAPVSLGFYFPFPVFGDIYEAIQQGFFSHYLSVIIPMGVFNVLGSLQNIESAEAAGDSYPTGKALAVNGAGTLVAGLFGSCFPTTIYIGHPGWKGLGSRAGYSILNAIFITIICFTGTVGLIFNFVPIEAGMAIVLWIGIVITAQAFSAVSRKHVPASVLGVLIGVGAWGTFMAKAGMRVADGALGNGLIWNQKISEISNGFLGSDIKITGAFALEQGCIFSAMIFSAITVMILDRNFIKASLWSLVGALLSLLGLTHAFEWGIKDAFLDVFSPAWPWVFGYLAMAVFFAIAKFVTVENSEADFEKDVIA